jgi:hypothetical protein
MNQKKSGSCRCICTSTRQKVGRFFVNSQSTIISVCETVSQRVIYSCTRRYYIRSQLSRSSPSVLFDIWFGGVTSTTSPQNNSWITLEILCKLVFLCSQLVDKHGAHSFSVNIIPSWTIPWQELWLRPLGCWLACRRCSMLPTQTTGHSIWDHLCLCCVGRLSSAQPTHRD